MSMDAIEYIETKMRTVPFTGNEGVKFAQMLEEVKSKKGKASMLNILAAIFILIGFLGAPLAILASVTMLVFLSFLGVVGGILLILAHNAKEDFDASKIYCLSYLAAVEARALSGTHVSTTPVEHITPQPSPQPSLTQQPLATTQLPTQLPIPSLDSTSVQQYPIEPQPTQPTTTQPQVSDVPTTTPLEHAAASTITTPTITTPTSQMATQTQVIPSTQPVSQVTTQPVPQVSSQDTQPVTQQPTQPTPQPTQEKKEEAVGIYTTAPPSTPGVPPWQCGICRGTIKQGLTVILCKCQQPYHDTCGERFGVCVMCGAKLPTKKDKGTQSTTQTAQPTTQSTQPSQQTAQPTGPQTTVSTQTQPQPTQPSKPGPGTVQSEGHTLAQPGQPTVKAGEKKTCAICNGLIKQGLSVVTCACGSIFHAACANRAAECPKCYRKL